MPKLTDELTDKVMRNLPVPETGNVLWYDPELKGFAGRVTYKGARAFVGVYHFEGVERRDTIGGFPEWKAKAARGVFKGWKRDVDLGIDPRGEPEPEDQGKMVFKHLAEQFLAHGRTKRGRLLRPSTKRDYRRALMVYAKRLHSKPVDQVRRSDAADLIRETATQRGATTAKNTRAAGSRFYSWLIANGKVEANPFTGTESYETIKRKRALADDELRDIWGATEERKDFNLIVRIEIWTGCRRQEAGSMRASEFGYIRTNEFEGEVWTVPGSRTKNHRDLALPLPRQAREALEAWPREDGVDLLFGRLREARPDQKRGGKGFQGWSRAKARLDARIARRRAERRLGRPLAEGEETTKEDWLRDWDLHDARRTVESRMAALGIRKEIVNRVLNHAQGPVTEHYDVYEYLREKADALQAWANELDAIVGAPIPNNVVLMRARC